MSLTALILAGALAGTAGQEKPVPASGEALPVSVEKIRKGLAQPEAITPEGAPRFRVEIIAPKPSIEDFLGKDFWKGNAAPVPGGAAMTHQEFLGIVTPPEYRGTAMYSNTEAMTIMATAVVFQFAIDKAMQGLSKALKHYREARKTKAKEDARKEVQDALAELDRARAAAGLAPLSGFASYRK